MKNNFMNIQLFAEAASEEEVETDDNELDDTDDFEEDDSYFDDADDESFYDADDEEDESEDETTSEVDEDETNQQEEDSSPVSRAELAKAINEAREQGLRQGRVNAFIGKTNHFTGEPIKDGADLSVYEMMQKIEVDGGDPINDLHKHIANSMRGQQEVVTKQRQSQANTRSDVTDFATKHPDVKISELMADKDFMLMAEGRLGSVPLSSIYESYKSIKSRIGETAERQAKSIVAKQKASPGALKGAGNVKTRMDESKAYEAMLRGSLD